MDPVIIGLISLVVGGLIFGGVYFYLRQSNANRVSRFLDKSKGGGVRIPEGEQSPPLLLVHHGGRIISINQQARDLFGLEKDEKPNLENIAKQIRPNEAFLSLCTAEGTSELAMQGRLVPTHSRRLDYDGVSLILIEFAIKTDKDTQGSSAIQPKVFDAYQKLSRLIDAHNEIQPAVARIIECIEFLLPADKIEVYIWEESKNQLTAYQLAGSPGDENRLVRLETSYRREEGLPGHIFQQPDPLLIEDIKDYTQRNSLEIEIQKNDAVTYLGIPLILAGDSLGTVIFHSQVKGAFSQQDLSAAFLLAPQIAYIIHNVNLRENEARRISELSNLLELTQGFSALFETRNLYASLIKIISSLVQVEVLGFLIYDESKQTLEGKNPFQGLPQEFIEIYFTHIQPNSAAEKILINQQTVITDDATTSEAWATLGLIHLSQAASLIETVLIPLVSAGRMLGYLQASNHTGERRAFKDSEINLLTLAAAQAAPIIENTNLIKENVEQSQHAVSLRRVSNLISSSGEVDDIIRLCLRELSFSFDAEFALLFLLDPGSTALALHPSSISGKDKIFPQDFKGLVLGDAQFPLSVTGSLHPLAIVNTKQEEGLIPYYAGIFEQQQIESAIMAPLIVQDQGIGEIWLASSNPSQFSQSDLLLLSSAAVQLAAMLENTRLQSLTDEVTKRKIDHYTTLRQIGFELNASPNLEYILQLIFDESIQASTSDEGTLLLVENEGENADFRINSFVGSPRFDELSQQEVDLLHAGKPIILDDLENEDIWKPNHRMRSALIAPVRNQQRTIGLLSLFSAEEKHYDQVMVEIIQSLAAQAGAAIGSQKTAEQLKSRVNQISLQLTVKEALWQVSQNLKWDQPLGDNLESVAEAVRKTTSFQVFCVSKYNPSEKALQWVYQKGLSQEAWGRIKDSRLAWKDIERCFQPDFRIGDTYCLPAHHEQEVLSEIRSSKTAVQNAAHPGFDTWQPGELVMVPLWADAGSPLGLICIDSPQNRKRPGLAEIQALSSFTHQTSLFLLNDSFTQSRAEQLASLEHLQIELRLELEDAAKEIDRLSSKLLDKQRENQHYIQQVNWLNAVPNILVATQKHADRDSYLQMLLEKLQETFAYDAALIAMETASGPRLLNTAGALKNDENVEVLLGQHNPIRQVFSTRRIEFVEDVSGHELWQGNPLLTSLEVGSYLLIPVRIEHDKTLAIFLLRYQSSTPVTDDLIAVIEQISGLIGNELGSLADLQDTTMRLGEVNALLDFNQQLDNLDPDRILNALLETVVALIPAADAAWMGLWDDKEDQLKPAAAFGYAESEEFLRIRFAQDSHSEPLHEGELSLPLRVLRQGGSKIVEEVQFAKDYLLTSSDLIHYRKATGGSLPASSLLVEMSRADHQMGILVLDTLDSAQNFTAEDQALATSLTQQTALALENARLFKETNRRTAQLLTLSEATGQIASTMKVEELQSLVLENVIQIIPSDTATLWLREDKTLRIAAVLGFKDMESRVGLSVAIEDSILFQNLDDTRQPIIVADIRQDQRFPALAQHEHLSWLGIPMISKSELIGVIALEKKEADYYSSDQVQAGMTFASQAALSLTNAALLEESIQRTVQLDQRSNRLALLNKLSNELIGSLSTDYILNTTIKQLHGALNLTSASAVLINEANQYILTAETPFEGEFSPVQLDDTTMLNHLRESRGIFSTNDVGAEIDLEPLTEKYFKPRAIISLLIIPLETPVKIIGWLWLQMDHTYRFSSSEMGLARTMANQAAIAIQNANLLSETRRLTNDLEDIVQERTHELHEEHKNTQTLLKMINQLSESMDMGKVLHKTLDVVREALNAEHCLIVLSDETNEIYAAGNMALHFAEGESLPRHAPERAVSAWVIETQSSILIPDTAAETRWQFDKTLPYSSLLGVPLTLEEQTLGTLFLLHSDKSAFSEEKISFVEAAARQISIAMNNANLFQLANNQSRRLSSMLHHQEIQSSRSLAILEAVADGILVTDEKNVITLYNTSAEKILGMNSSQVLDQSLMDFESQLSMSKTYWLETILRWSKEPDAIREGENFAQQLNLEDARVVLVHLAPVKSGNTFLGTVSILRDITQEVLVDRLKSDFVANVSHELRTPLTSIKGYADLMMMGASGELSEQQLQFMKVIRNNTNRLNVLVNDLLDISHIDAGQLALSFEPVALIELSEKILQDINRLAAEDGKTIRFTLECPHTLSAVSGDEEKIRQVVMNLVSNAYHYTPNGGDVIVRLQQKPYEIQVDVIDNGIGITRENSQRIFERFYRGENPLVLATAGTGLGLAISKILIEMHGGRIWFESSGIEGEGSVFSFTLPLEIRNVI